MRNESLLRMPSDDSPVMMIDDGSGMLTFVDHHVTTTWSGS
jgi:hypothetical protein